ncbi:TPA: hypothetical protein DIV55_04270 [Patescibacteria group bacterium]|nr:hypothetical protein [Patescibacteria group bacterium]
MVEQNRPYVVCHMMSTIDGKIASGVKGVEILNDHFEIYTQVEHLLEAKAWLCGRVTMEMFAQGVGTPLPPLTKEVDSSDFIAPYNGSNFMVAVDTKGLLRWDSNMITLSNQPEKEHLIVVVTSQTPKDYLAYLQSKSISYVFGGQEEVDFGELFHKLKDKFHIDRLLLEGGGLLNGSVMAAGLVDEISLLVTPLALNKASAPSVFERRTDDVDVTKYSLFEVKQMDKDTVWLRYKKKV